MPRDTIISLPKSKTSTGIYAVRDENVQHHAPREAKKQAPDHGFVAMTEVGMFQELNEQLQPGGKHGPGVGVPGCVR